MKSSQTALVVLGAAAAFGLILFAANRASAAASFTMQAGRRYRIGVRVSPPLSAADVNAFGNAIATRGGQLISVNQLGSSTLVVYDETPPINGRLVPGESRVQLTNPLTGQDFGMVVQSVKLAPEQPA